MKQGASTPYLARPRRRHDIDRRFAGPRDGALLSKLDIYASGFLETVPRLNEGGDAAATRYDQYAHRFLGFLCLAGLGSG